MKVTVLSCTVGQGHNAASQALKNYMTAQGHDVTILDTYKYANAAIGLGMDVGYSFLGRFWPKLNETIYEGAEKRNGRSDMRSYFPWVFADLTKSRLAKYLEAEKPDAIVSPIVMTAMMVTSLRESEMLDPAIMSVGIITDYSMHPFWEYTDMDYFVAANELMIPSMVRRGIPKEKILATGIPIDPKFASHISKEEARKKLGLEQGKQTILMSAGGMGFAGLTAAAQEIDRLDDVQLIAVCGSNKMLQKKLRGMEFHNTMHVLGFVKNMDEYMDAADIVVSKPGGLSTSEAIAKEKPLLLTDPMPGVENMNHAFLLNNSLAVHANEYQPLSEVILQMRSNPYKEKEMQAAQARWGKKDSAKSLGDFLTSVDTAATQEVWRQKEEVKLTADGGKAKDGRMQKIRGQGGGHHRGRTGLGSGISRAFRTGRRPGGHWRFEL